ncbi:hypothetical protein LCGC14_0976700 [marine sediment metagenome]|uniref:Uncharacterized protein n=1 Tax=marine sediment metagenome TaxID=412755 RepID=A0A0F9NA18_9ZZZZ
MPVESKAPMVLGLGAALGGIFLLFRKKKPTLPEPPADGVVVGLINPPGEAENWSITLTDWDITVPIRETSGKDRLDIAEVAAFEIPSGVAFPLRVVALQITRWNEDRTALIVLYEVQSFRPIKPFDDEPDPNYREVFIPDYGSYYYNVSKERFED